MLIFFLLLLTASIYSMEMDDGRFEQVPFEEAALALEKCSQDHIIITIYDDSAIKQINQQLNKYKPKEYLKDWREKMVGLFKKAENKQDNIKFMKLSHNSLMTALQELKSDLVVMQQSHRASFIALSLSQLCLVIMLAGHMLI